MHFCFSGVDPHFRHGIFMGGGRCPAINRIGAAEFDRCWEVDDTCTQHSAPVLAKPWADSDAIGTRVGVMRYRLERFGAAGSKRSGHGSQGSGSGVLGRELCSVRRGELNVISGRRPDPLFEQGSGRFFTG